MTHTLKIEMDELIEAMETTPAEFDREFKFLALAKLYELGKISSGRAARICGMGRVEFLMSLGRVGVSAINLTAEDLEEDLKFGRGE
jgi:predicted HTH domain antitoxin